MNKATTPTYAPVDGLLSNADFFAAIVENLDSLPKFTTTKRETFYNIPAAFDIETSSFYDGEEKCAIMYEWTFGILNWVTYGRTWEQLKLLLSCIAGALNLDQDHRLIVYVHNLPYEFQFMRKRFSWTKVFLLDDRKPVYAITDFGVEFRCSLKLSGKSLANTAKDLTKYPCRKMVGDLDYSKIRHSQTPLTPEELKYCENDVRVVLSYIMEKIEQDGNISLIPLTNTGYVRRYCRKACFPEMGENEYIDEESDIGTIGVSPTERMFSRWFHPRQCPVCRQDFEECGFLRFYEFVSRRNDRGKISNGKREEHRFGDTKRALGAGENELLYVLCALQELGF